MKLIDDIVLTEVAGDYVAVPVGEASQVLRGIVRLNKTGFAVTPPRTSLGLQLSECHRE